VKGGVANERLETAGRREKAVVLLCSVLLHWGTVMLRGRYVMSMVHKGDIRTV